MVKQEDEKTRPEIAESDEVQSTEPGGDVLDMEQAIALLKTTRPTFYRWLRAGKLKGRNYESVGIVNFHETPLPGALIISAVREHTRTSAVRILLDPDGVIRQRWGFFRPGSDHGQIFLQRAFDRV